MDLISVIVPCYNEELGVLDFYNEMMKTQPYFSKKNIDFEFFFIDDGSTDQTLNEIKKIMKTNAQVHFISFSRNFGKEAGILAGMEKATGKYLTLMDVDLQDPPSMLPEMFEALEDGYDMIATRRISRKGEPIIRSFFARIFYRFLKKHTDAEIVDGSRDYRLMKRQVAESVLSLHEYNRFSKGLFGWVGFKTKWLEFENIKRNKGETKWSFWKLVVYSIEGITSFSTAPLAFSAVIGVLFCIIAFISIIAIIIRTLAFGDPVGGWPSLVCIIALVSGVQLFCIGILGQYLSKTYLEVKRRPLYIVKESK